MICNRRLRTGYTSDQQTSKQLVCQVSSGTDYVSFALHRARCGNFGLISSQPHHLPCCLSCSLSSSKVGGRHLYYAFPPADGLYFSAHWVPSSTSLRTHVNSTRKHQLADVEQSRAARNGITTTQHCETLTGQTLGTRAPLGFEGV